MWTWLLLSSLTLARGEIVDRVVVDVDGQLILQSDVHIENALVGLDPEATPFWNDAWGSSTQRLIDAAAIRWAAADVRLYDPTRVEIRACLDRIQTSFETPQAWTGFLDRLGLDEAELTLVLRRRLVVDRYLLRTLQQDPVRADAWRAEGLAHLDQLHRRVRIRRIGPADRGP